MKILIRAQSEFHTEKDNEWAYLNPIEIDWPLPSFPSVGDILGLPFFPSVGDEFDCKSILNEGEIRYTYGANFIIEHITWKRIDFVITVIIDVRES